MKKRIGNKKQVVIFFGGLILVSLVLTFLPNLKKKNTDNNTKTPIVSVEEVKEYSQEELSADTFNIDNIDSLSDEEREKLDDINGMKLSTYMLNEKKLEQDLTVLFGIGSDFDAQKAVSKVGGTQDLYDSCLCTWEGFGSSDIDYIDIYQSGVQFNNNTECRYFVLCSVIYKNLEPRVFLVDVRYNNKVMVYFNAKEV